MSTVYQPSNIPPGTDPALALWLSTEMNAIKRGLEEAMPTGNQYKVLYAEPARPRTGRVVYADGTEWNPGSGEGLYRRSLANTWVFLG